MIQLSTRITGKGDPIILLHGFPMNKHVWDDFSKNLSENFTVITIDLPGFGDSPSLKFPFSLEQVADEIISWLLSNKIQPGVLIGHSLGGYVALSMIEKRQDLFSGLCLFHSTAYADAEEKKQSRTKVLEFIEKNGVTAFTSNFIAPLFFDQNHPAIETVRNIAIQSSADTVKGYTIAMRDRVDRTDTLKNFVKPVLFITGEKDNGIPIESIKKQSTLVQRSQVHVLEEVAHMSMFEKPKEVTGIIQSFAVKCFQ